MCAIETLFHHAVGIRADGPNTHNVISSASADCVSGELVGGSLKPIFLFLKESTNPFKVVLEADISVASCDFAVLAAGERKTKFKMTFLVVC